MVLYLRWSSSLPGSVFDTTCKSLATVADGQAYHARQGEALSQNEHHPMQRSTFVQVEVKILFVRANITASPIFE